MSSDREKLDRLSERIRQAETKPKKKVESSPWRNAGYDFAGTLIGSVILGVLLDRAFDSAPWCLVAMVVLGFISGILGVWKVLQTKDPPENE
ncbi:MAG: AtpZ/AtpI family protein [Alphaproteobacteria bacterium]|nr:AtpZ/AtpI family protein [Alphaproteobacteria bacterium]